jgi:hypothetical protein
LYPGCPNQTDDTKEQRLEWFKSCLDAIRVNSKYKDLISIAVPEYIGCGSAGGDWSLYKQELEKLAADTDLTIYIHKMSNR